MTKINTQKPSQVQIMSEIMYQALGERVGLLLQVGDVRRVQAIFSAARGKDPALMQLSCRLSPIEGGNLILVKTREGEILEKGNSHG